MVPIDPGTMHIAKANAHRTTPICSRLINTASMLRFIENITPSFLGLLNDHLNLTYKSFDLIFKKQTVYCSFLDLRGFKKVLKLKIINISTGFVF
jgi:hypothetical protein